MLPIADIHKNTARTKIDSTIEEVLKDLPDADNSPVKSLDSFNVLKQGPANQQEGEAYDKELNDFTDRNGINENIEDSNAPSQYFEDNKLSQIEDDSDDYKDLESSHKHLKLGNNVKRANLSEENKSVVAQEFEYSSDNYVDYKQPFFKRLFNYMNMSSLFIFHESWTIRQWLIMIVINTESLTTKMPKSLRKHTSKVANSEEPNEDAKVEKQEGEDKENSRANNMSEQSKDSDEKENKSNENSLSEIEDSFEEELESLPLKPKIHDLSSIVIVEGRIITTKKKKAVSKWFENIIILLILLNSCALVLDNPLANPNGSMARVFYYLDIVFTILFTIEAIMKIIAMGFFWN